ISAHYLIRHGKELQPTPKAIQTITLLKNAVPELTSPELTGEWEFRLREIEHRKLTRDAFMRDIRELTNDIVGKAKHFHPDEHMPDSEPLGKCPKCGGRVFELGMSYICENSVGPEKTCDFRSGKVILQRPIDHDQMKKLLATGKTDLLERFISRKGRPFKAFLVLTDKKDVGFEFENPDPKAKKERKPKEPTAKIDFTGKEPVGECPVSGGKVLDTDTAYICEHSQADRKRCKFKLSKTILGRDIPKEQAQKLLSAGKTDLLDSFISKRGRPFSAYLKLEEGKIGFEFPEKTAQPSEGKQVKNTS